MQFQGGTAFRGGMGNTNAFRGSVAGNQFQGQFRGGFPRNRNFAQFRRFRNNGAFFAFGAPYLYDDYYPYSYYSDDDCYVTRRVPTRYGWRYVQVDVCNY